MLSLAGSAQQTYELRIRPVDRDSVQVQRLGLQTTFPSVSELEEYLTKLPDLLQGRGYITASIDSVRYDSTHALIHLYLGEAYRWAVLRAEGIETPALQQAGWRDNELRERPVNFERVYHLQARLLDYYENRGYPFARVYLDSVRVREGEVSGLLKVNRGPLYKIDSLRVYGNVRISNQYLQRYLDLPNGSIYSKEKLQSVSRRIRQLPYLEEEQPPDLTMLGTGSVLNLYLRPKKSSQVNVLIGFLPNNDQLANRKLLITGEANIHLRNLLGEGEAIGLNWQQLQVNSQRLQLSYQHPYVLRSAWGLDLGFDIFRKDTTFVNINLQAGAQYQVGRNQNGTVFLQRFQTIVNGINRALVLQTRKLPAEVDVSVLNMGVAYDFNNTDYRLNPRSGMELNLMTAIGSRKIRKNNLVTELKDPSDPGFNFEKLYDTVRLNTYQLKLRAGGARYFPLGKRSTFKTGVQAGLLESASIFRNELFQVGGFKMLRGFDEESQYLSHFAVGTIEYRYLVGQNSFFYALVDGGWGRQKTNTSRMDYGYIGTGVGLAFETRPGIFHIAWAVGRRSDTDFNLRQSKIHVGFVNYF
ncbi:MAG TPA: hypothetical protein VEB63_12465 [Chitinophagaceae bacterium]|nr:hypothetical protein [Chitinophagaceae bacterium]